MAGETDLLRARLDRAMEEVFGTMLGVSCARVDPGPQDDGLSVAALIGLAGALIGTLVLQADAAAARQVTALMTGAQPGAGPDEIEPVVRDAMGELANIVAGSWKGYDGNLASKCLLATPAVVTGSRYELFNQRAAIRIEETYGFDGFQCTVTVACQKA